MTGTLGRQVNFFFGGNSPADRILGVREKSVECNGEAINVTSDEDGGVRVLLENLSAEDEVNITVSGVIKDTRLKEAWFNNQRTQPIALNYPAGAILAGTFYMSSYKEGAPYKDAVTFEAQFQSSGAVTFTA